MRGVSGSVFTHNLRHVQNDDGGLETDTETGDQTTGDDTTKTGGSNLDDNTDDVDHAAEDDGILATNDLSHVTSDDSTKEGTGGQDRDDEGVVRGAERSGGRAFDIVDEESRASDTVDVSGVVTEEDTTEGRESAHQVGFPGDRSLDAGDIVGSCESSSHYCGGCEDVLLFG